MELEAIFRGSRKRRIVAPRPGIRRLALELDNSPEWAIIDLACISVGIVIVPIPPFFSETQKNGCVLQRRLMRKLVVRVCLDGTDMISHSVSCRLDS